MGAAGDQAALDEGGAGEALAHPPQRARRPTARDDGHALALGRVAGDRRVDDALVAPRDRRTPRPGSACRWCASGTTATRARCAASFLAAISTPEVSLSSRCTIPGRSTPPTPERSSAVGEQRVDEGAVGVAGGGVDDQAGRLVDDDQVLVLEQHVERDLLGHELGRRRTGGGVDLDRRRRAAELAAGLAGRAVAGDVALVDPAGDLRARPAVPGPGQEAVEPQPGGLARHDQRDGRSLRSRRAPTSRHLLAFPLRNSPLPSRDPDALTPDPGLLPRPDEQADAERHHDRGDAPGWWRAPRRARSRGRGRRGRTRSRSGRCRRSRGRRRAPSRRGGRRRNSQARKA